MLKDYSLRKAMEVMEIPAKLRTLTNMIMENAQAKIIIIDSELTENIK